MAEVSVQSSKTQKGGTDRKKTVSSKSGADLSQSLDSPVKQILFLQRTIGNRAVTQLFQSGAIQAKFKIGKPNDIYEREADRVSEQVVRRRDESLVNGQWSLGKRVTPLIQRQEQPEEEEERKPEEEEQIQTKPIADQITPLIQRQAEEEEEPAQTKLVQCQESEEEGGQAKPLIQREAEEKEEEGQTKPLIQRQAEEKEEEGQAKPLLQRRAGEGSSGQVSSGLESRLSASKGGGQPMSPETRSFMEPRFDADFSDVRIHTDTSAAEMNKEINAQAFTTGKDIYFGSGNYSTSTTGGKRLLAHELTHVVQQGSAVQRKKLVNQSSPQVIQRAGGGSWGSLGGIIRNIGSLISEGISAAKRFFGNTLRRIPGYRLLGVVMGEDPLTGVGIDRSGRNFIEAGLDIIPFGRAFKRRLQQEGALDRAAAWLDNQIKELRFSPTQIAAQFRQFWNYLMGNKFKVLTGRGNVVQRLRAIFEPPINRIKRFARNIATRLKEILKSFLTRKLIGFVRRRTRAYPLVTVILGRDPISGREVRRTPMALLRGFMGLSQTGAEQLRQMQASGSLQRAANWINRSIARLTGNLRRIRSGFLNIWRTLSIRSVLHPITTFQSIYNTFAGPVGDIIAFLGEVVIMILRFIKDALLRRLKAYARTVRGFPLLTVILGKDPFTGESVPRTATNFVRGFLSLLDNGEERFRNLQRSGALARAFAWLNTEVDRLNLTWDDMVALFRTAWDSFSIRDLRNPLAAFMRIVNLFRAPVGRILRFAFAVGLKILEFVFTGVMGSGGARVLNILKRGRECFLTIIRDPVAFLGHLIDSVKLGFQQFSRNILRHLQAGLLGWLFGALQGAGLQIPERFDLRGIISLVLQILGLTYERIKPRLVRLLGERTVSFLERTFDFLRRWVEDPASIWEKIVEYAGNLRDRVIDGIKNFVITRIVQAAVMKLATMLNPVGAVIQAIITIYNTVMFFVERINQIMAVVESVINSICNIAAGNISAAANYVEQTMARTIPVIISFLARLLGLGNIAGNIRRVIEERIHQPIDRAINRVVAWVARQARRFRRGVSSVAGRIVQWWRLRKQFRTRSGESHTLFFQGSGRNAMLMIQSKKRTYKQFIDDIDITAHDKKGNEKRQAKAAAYRVARRIDKLKDEEKVVPDPKRRGTTDQSSTFTELLDRLAEHTQILKESGGIPISTPPEYGPLGAGGFGTKMEIKVLSKISPPGSRPEVTNPLWESLLQRRKPGRRGSYYVRSHLLSNRLGGLGTTWKNLAPMTQGANLFNSNSHYRTVEKPIIEGTKNGEVFSYTVIAGGSSAFRRIPAVAKLKALFPNQEDKVKKVMSVIRAEQYIPGYFKCTAHELDPNTLESKSGTNINKTIPNDVDPEPANYEVK